MTTMSINTPGEKRGKIAFVGTHGPNRRWDIFSMNADGTDLRQLTARPHLAYQPRYSPDGRQIVFVAGHEQEDQIFIMSADGTDQRCLTAHQGGCYGPCTSPDGGTVAFSALFRNGLLLCLVNTDGTDFRVLTQPTEFGVGVSHPVFTTDGQSIIYNTVGYPYIVDIDGRNERPVFPDLFDAGVGNYGGFQFSPDGQKVAFVRSTYVEHESYYDWIYTVMTIDIDGTNARELVPQFRDSRFPTFSPDGSHLAFTAFRELEPGNQPVTDNDQARTDAARNDTARNDADYDEDNYDEEDETPYEAGIFIARIDGTELEQIADDSLQPTNLCWGVDVASTNA